MKKTVFSYLIIIGLAICQLSAGTLGVSALEEVSTPGYEKGVVVSDDDIELKNQLLGINNSEDYLLGIASQFSIFLSNDLSAYNSDCEGRIAIGGGANFVETGYCYAVDIKNRDNAEFTDKRAGAIIGRGALLNLDMRDLVVAVPVDISDNDIHYESSQTGNIYRAELIDFDNEFRFLRDISDDISEWESNGVVELNSGWQGCTVFSGNSKVNIFNITAEQMQEISDGCQTEYRVPEDSIVIVNVSGDSVKMMGNQGTSFNSKALLNNDILAGNILYNCYEAEEVEYTGSFYGSTLAVDAEFNSSNYGHISGQLIGKSFNGIIEVGCTLFNQNSIEPLITTPTETTTPSEETTITTGSVSSESIETAIESEVTTVTTSDSLVTSVPIETTTTESETTTEPPITTPTETTTPSEETTIITTGSVYSESIETTTESEVTTVTTSDSLVTSVPIETTTTESETTTEPLITTPTETTTPSEETTIITTGSVYSESIETTTTTTNEPVTTTKPVVTMATTGTSRVNPVVLNADNKNTIIKEVSSPKTGDKGILATGIFGAISLITAGIITEKKRK